jgi:hypothetical protein
MTIFLLILILAIVVIYIIKKVKKANSLNESQEIKVPKTEEPATRIDERPKTDSKVYKKKGIKSFDIKGTYHRKLDIKTFSREFTGYAICENNSHDKYAVAIYNHDNVLLGFTPKGNIRLNSSLKEWHNGKIFAWGGLYYDDFERKWLGGVNIPIGLSPSEIANIENIVKLRSINDEQIKAKEFTTDKYFEILYRHKEIHQKLESLEYRSDIYYSFPKNLIPSISKHLEQEKNWVKLMELEQYPELINDLSEKFRSSTEKRIELAKNKLATTTVITNSSNKENNNNLNN